MTPYIYSRLQQREASLEAETRQLATLQKKFNEKKNKDLTSLQEQKKNWNVKLQATEAENKQVQEQLQTQLMEQTQKKETAQHRVRDLENDYKTKELELTTLRVQVARAKKRMQHEHDVTKAQLKAKEDEHDVTKAELKAKEDQLVRAQHSHLSIITGFYLSFIYYLCNVCEFCCCIFFLPNKDSFNSCVVCLNAWTQASVLTQPTPIRLPGGVNHVLGCTDEESDEWAPECDQQINYTDSNEEMYFANDYGEETSSSEDAGGGLGLA